MGLLRAFSALFMGLGLTAALYSQTNRTQIQLQTQHSLALARQISDELELLARSAQDQQEKNPFGWASHFLNSGAEERPVHVSVISSDLSEGEAYLTSQNQFIYLRRLKADTGETARIELKVPYVGFLGSSSPLGNDFFVVLTSLIFILLFILLLRSKNSALALPTSQSASLPQSYTDNPHLDHLKPNPTLFDHPGLRAALTQLGLKVKFLTQSAKNLVLSSHRTHELIPSVSELASQLSVESDILPFLQTWENRLGEFQEERSKLQKDVDELNHAITESTQEMLNIVKFAKGVK